jgi:hypothetical protein
MIDELLSDLNTVADDLDEAGLAEDAAVCRKAAEVIAKLTQEAEAARGGKQ